MNDLNASGAVSIWPDFDHVVPDWDAILTLGFPGLRERARAYRECHREQGTLIGEMDAHFEGIEITYTAILNLIDRLCSQAVCQTHPKAADMATCLAHIRDGAPRTMYEAMQFVWQGEKTGATPDGRRAGEEISKNASPSVGMDRNGVTALINSALRLHPATYAESFCLDLMLHPSAVAGERGLDVMKALLMTYLYGDGMSLQMNIFDAETLKDAQRHPDRYRNLQVRICGWNVLWNNLSRTEQDAYIRRAERIQV